MGCRDGEPIWPRSEIEQNERTDALRALMRRFAKVSMNEFTLEESLLMHKLHVADAFTFPPKIDKEGLAMLKAAERRIFGKKGRKGNPYAAGGTIDSGRNAL
jgi:hypothetical protein